MTPTPVPEDSGPTVSMQLDDDRIVAGQGISITLIADDESGIEWIEWEGIVADSDDNGNDHQDTGDEELDAEHRLDCDGRTQCANVWQVNPQTPGTLRLAGAWARQRRQPLGVG